MILCIDKNFSTNHESRLKQARVYRENMQKMSCQYDSILKLHDLILFYALCFMLIVEQLFTIMFLILTFLQIEMGKSANL